MSTIPWSSLEPDKANRWLTNGQQSDFAVFNHLGSLEAVESTESIFKIFSLGVASNRDAWAYNSQLAVLTVKILLTIDSFEKAKARAAKAKASNTTFKLQIDEKSIKWTERLVAALEQPINPSFEQERIRSALYRPFRSMYSYFDSLLNERQYKQRRLFPKLVSVNTCISIGGYGRVPFSVLAASSLSNLNLFGDPQQTFPFYTYDEDGTNRQENITDWALTQYQTHYNDLSITKWDIFHSTYALLHHPEYRTRYAANLKRELPASPSRPTSTPRPGRQAPHGASHRLRAAARVPARRGR